MKVEKQTLHYEKKASLKRAFATHFGLTNNSNTNISAEVLEAFVILSTLEVSQIESLFNEKLLKMKF